MFICIHNNKFLASAALVVVALSLASCGRADSTAKAHAGQADTSVAGQFSARLPDEAALSDGALPTLIERRHFAIYSDSRMLFDGPPEAFTPGIGMQDEGGLAPVVTMDGGVTGNLPACSIRDMLIQD